MRQTSNQFTIIKSKRFNVCLTIKENHLLLFTLTHTNYLSRMRQYIALSPLFSSPHTTLSLSLGCPLFLAHLMQPFFASISKSTSSYS